jgi:hypothetical protein
MKQFALFQTYVKRGLFQVGWLMGRFVFGQLVSRSFLCPRHLIQQFTLQWISIEMDKSIRVVENREKVYMAFSLQRY